MNARETNGAATGVDREQASSAEYSKAYRAWVLGLIFVMMASNYIDRTIIRVLAEPIRIEFGLSDLQIGVLGGLAFAMFYVVMGVPIAACSERRNRVHIISAAIAVWSVTTMLCGLASSYLQLLLARMGVGIGEAGAAPPSQSLIADYFPPETRASALSIHSFGIAIGAVLGAVIGGFAAEAWGWRGALMLVGAPGLLLALLFILTVKEPPRGRLDKANPRLGVDSPRVFNVARALFTNATFLHLALGAGIANFAVNGLHTFEALYFVRRFEIGLGQAGLIIGLTGGLSAAAGMLAGGFVADRLARADRRWYAWLPAIGMGLAGPLYASAFLQSSWQASALVLALPGLILFLYAAPSQAVIHNMSHPRMRATAISLYFVVTATLGVALGPVGTGWLADLFASSAYGSGDYAAACQTSGAQTSLACRQASASGVQYALIGVCALFIWSACHFVMAARTVRRDMDQGIAIEPAAAKEEKP